MESIGALKQPPPVSSDMFYASIVLDVAGLLLALIIDLNFLLLVLVYIGVSKAYSWEKIRLKKYAITGWLTVILFQGGYTYMLVSMAASDNLSPNWFTEKNIAAMLFATLLIGAYYPLTQIYQHPEDGSRGDRTISIKLGIRGTFLFSAIFFMNSFAFAFYYFDRFDSPSDFLIMMLSLLPATGYFLYWFLLTIRDAKNADFEHSMRMTFISSSCLLIAFSILLIENQIN